MNEIVRAAFVIARRDFTALIRSKAFIFFLLGPIIMLLVALGAGVMGADMAREEGAPLIAVALPDADAARLGDMREKLEPLIVDLPRLERAKAGVDARRLLHEGRAGAGYAAVLSGSLDSPVLDVRASDARSLSGKVQLLIGAAREGVDPSAVRLDVRATTLAPPPADRSVTARLGQIALFLATMLLAGMVLSNLVEEKANKIIEILAASIPMEGVFLGKLFAMLAMALIAICVWVGIAGLAGLAIGSGMPVLPAPAVGWPLFLVLGMVYFSTTYLLLGSAYLSIGAMAATVRDVQTLSMPVSMAQLGIFLFANYATVKAGTPLELFACVFPFSSPFALLARAAQFPDLWPHLLALVWQALWTWAIIWTGTRIFRRHVMKSGPSRRRASKKRLARS